MKPSTTTADPAVNPGLNADLPTDGGIEATSPSPHPDAPTPAVPEDAERAVTSSREPADTPSSAAVFPLRRRRQWARDFGRLVAADADRLANLAHAEIGKPSWEVLVADVMPLVASCRWHARHAGRVLRTRRAVGRPAWLLGHRASIRRLPLGRVGIIATWNYPVQLLGVQLLQAVVAGNTVVVKPSERAPRTQARLLELAVAAGLPRGVLEIRPSDRDAGAALLSEPLDHVVFTGSTAVGRRVAEACATRLLPSTLELSGCDSAVVLEDADLELAARSIWAALTMNHGQTCMAPRRILVQRSVAARFSAAIVPLVEGASPRRLADPEARHHQQGLIADAVGRGARVLPTLGDAGDHEACRASLILDCPPEARAFREDHFGPLLVVAAFDDEHDLAALHAAGGKHLATSIFTRDLRRADRLAATFRSGIVTINDALVPTAHPGTPIPATGEAGWGASQGREGLLEMTRPMVQTRSGRLRPPSGEPDPRSLAFLRGLVRWWGRGATPPPVEGEH